ncbi:amino acid ABC transporter permease [Aureibacillus halotolerans]|uniref:Amino acid ABC transporter membrane protein (PAAT family) n=1 Tax=Aureibacillus halotolerans TaxID=1508390 RepID=A0A4V3D6A1_9BACI|nr:amino acid ABC transporter permease [Aureibacillus halotolerans]TDQ43017.1 amino acid ABC transporter membrane protein (PAAT family) [Aureibacillus halotolerans]
MSAEYLSQVLPLLLEGFWITFYIIILGMFFGTLIGIVFGLMRLSRSKIVLFLASIYIEIVRGTPMLAQIFFIYFGISEATGINLDKTTTGVIVIAINAGAYLAEIFRAGIQSVDKGQMEAGRSLGLTHNQTMRQIIWPQALKLIIPPYGNQFIISLKDTSLLSAIAVGELLYNAKQFAATDFSYFETFALVCVFYLIITIPSSILLRRYERRIERA